MNGLSWAAVSLVLLGSYAIAWLSARIGVAIALRALRGSEGASWVERARLAYPSRLAAGQSLGSVPFAIGAIVSTQVAPALELPAAPLAILGGLAALAATMRVTTKLELRFCRPSQEAGSRPGGVPVAFLLALPGLVVFGLMIAAMPSQWGWPAAMVTIAGLALLAFQIAAGWMIPLRWLGLVKPASARLTGIVDRASERMGVGHRGVYELDSPNTNAIAWTVAKQVVFTGPIAEVLDDDELASIAAHELGHLNEPWGVYLYRIISPLFLVAAATTIPLSNSYGPLAGMAPFLGLLAFVLIGHRVGRKMEERSDRLGREHEGDDAGTYARALATIHEANLMPVVLKAKQGVHPDLYDRLIAAGVTPEYPRPAPPPNVGLASAPLIILLVAAGLAIGERMTRNLDRGYPRRFATATIRWTNLISISGTVSFQRDDP